MVLGDPDFLKKNCSNKYPSSSIKPDKGNLMELENTNLVTQNKTKSNRQTVFYKLTYAFAVIFLFTLVSCGGGGGSTGPDPDPNPDPTPDPDRPVSFSEDIEPIFNGNCAVSGCHTSSIQESGVDLSSYESALNSVGNQYGTEIIIPGEPENSPIVDKISNDNPEFGERMPYQRGQLSSAQIDSIIAWIDDGAPNN